MSKAVLLFEGQLYFCADFKITKEQFYRLYIGRY